MIINTLYLPGFSHRLNGGRHARVVERNACSRLDGFAKWVGRYVPQKVFDGVPHRERVFTPWVTFCAFLVQAFVRGASCREAVQGVQAWRVSLGLSAPSTNTAAFCSARGKLKAEVLRKAHEALVERLETNTQEQSKWCGRVVKLIDGTGFSMPDTDPNRKVYPYAGGQKKGCGFPVGKLVALFSVAGHLVRLAHQSWKTHDISLARLLVGWVNKAEVLVGDRGFCGWGMIALVQRKGVEVVMRLHQNRPHTSGRSCWTKPQRPATWDAALWAELPEGIEVRTISFRVQQPGFRTKTITLVTTLLDETAYPDQSLIELYGLRWQIEGNYRDIKTTLGLDVLCTRTPEMIEREILMQAIAHNLVRATMLEAANAHRVPLNRISFKGTATSMRQWAPLLSHASATKRHSLHAELLHLIASDLLPLRPNRSEPRAVKRRPKPYQLLTQPRHAMRVSASRRA